MLVLKLLGRLSDPDFFYPVDTHPDPESITCYFFKQVFKGKYEKKAAVYYKDNY